MIAIAVERKSDRATVVTVLPITHRAPAEQAAAVELPPSIKRHLRLDDSRSWVVLSEGDQFVWPGYDLRKIAGTNRFDYGFLPPRFFMSILKAFRDWHHANKVRLTPRA